MIIFKPIDIDIVVMIICIDSFTFFPFNVLWVIIGVLSRLVIGCLNFLVFYLLLVEFVGLLIMVIIIIEISTIGVLYIIVTRIHATLLILVVVV